MVAATGIGMRLPSQVAIHVAQNVLKYLVQKSLTMTIASNIIQNSSKQNSSKPNQESDQTSQGDYT